MTSALPLLPVYTGEQVRAAEAPLLESGQGPELMRRASWGLAAAVLNLLRERGTVYGARVAGLIGSGNNGGDGLWALTFLRRRSFVLDLAVVLASLGGSLIGMAVLTLFVGALRDAATASILFACFGAALVCTVAAIGAFMAEILMAGHGIRDEVDHQKDKVPAQG